MQPHLKRLFLGLMIAALAYAQTNAQEPAPSSRPARADFRGDAVPIDVRRMANWVVASADNGSLPFAIIDKKEADVFVFDSEGRILGFAPVLLGLGVGDESAPGIGNKPLSAIPPKDRTTPAGRFVATLGHEGKTNLFWVDYKNNIAMHRVVTGTPRDHRLQRLATPTPLDNRISFGCINVPVDFFDRTLLPAFKSAKGVVYILPDVKATRDVFPHYYDVDG
jgi:hypothetical protein